MKTIFSILLLMFPVLIFSQEVEIKMTTSGREINLQNPDAALIEDTVFIETSEPVTMLFMNSGAMVLSKIEIKDHASFLPLCHDGMYYLIFISNGEVVKNKKIFLKTKNHEKNKQKRFANVV